MPQTILHKRGLEQNLPQLQEAELGFTIDKHDLYVGSSIGNIKLAKADQLTDLETKEGAQAKAEATLQTAKEYSDSKIEELIGTAPDTLDTIYELAEAIRSLSEEEMDSLVTALAGKADADHQHNTSQILEVDDKRFVTTAQMNKWDNAATETTELGTRIEAIEGVLDLIDGGTF